MCGIKTNQINYKKIVIKKNIMKTEILPNKEAKRDGKSDTKNNKKH